eukprot:CAMPEP_0184526628 /NCGR_PEP_ID=MMETSP0198_2-20121128/10757_1 /TAXON_ID=1112570 /ORGANISM="Thraustochytrium sp., Strain LLF1b" /LENGTH=196 /DNA_ID=CAMNT_0026918215 /DNA_START=123 /DNA_END=713 /DNA_ORIENTATION=+
MSEVTTGKVDLGEPVPDITNVASQLKEELTVDEVNVGDAKAQGEAETSPSGGFLSSLAAKLKEAEHAVEDALNLEHDSIAKTAEAGRQKIGTKLTEAEHIIEDKLNLEPDSIQNKASGAVSDVQGKIGELQIPEKLSTGIDTIKEKLNAEELLAKAKAAAHGIEEQVSGLTGKKDQTNPPEAPVQDAAPPSTSEAQ